MKRRMLLLVCAALVVGVTGSASSTYTPAVWKQVWLANFETGDFSAFKDTPWDVARGGLQPEIVSGDRLVHMGRYSVKMSIPGPANSAVGICCGGRSELEPKIADLKEGDDLYFYFSTLLERNFPVSGSWQVITQWKNKGDGSPPIELSIEDGSFALTGGYGFPGRPQRFELPISRAATDRWFNWLIHVKFSVNPAIGSVWVWLNGRLVIADFHPRTGTLYPDPTGPSSYLKFGYYRDPAISEPGSVYFDDWQVLQRIAIDGVSDVKS